MHSGDAQHRIARLISNGRDATIDEKTLRKAFKRSTKLDLIALPGMRHACPPCPPDRTRLPHHVGRSASGGRKVRAQHRRIAGSAILARSCWMEQEVVGAAAGTGAVVRKPPRKESAGSGAPWLSVRYGDLAGADGAAGARGFNSNARHHLRSCARLMHDMIASFAEFRWRLVTAVDQL